MILQTSRLWREGRAHRNSMASFARAPVRIARGVLVPAPRLDGGAHVIGDARPFVAGVAHRPLARNGAMSCIAMSGGTLLPRMSSARVLPRSSIG